MHLDEVRFAVADSVFPTIPLLLETVVSRISSRTRMTLKHAEQPSRLSIVYDVRSLWATGNIRGREAQFDLSSGKSNIVVNNDANRTPARIDRKKDIWLAWLVPGRVDEE